MRLLLRVDDITIVLKLAVRLAMKTEHQQHSTTTFAIVTVTYKMGGPDFFSSVSSTSRKQHYAIANSVLVPFVSSSSLVLRDTLSEVEIRIIEGNLDAF